MLRKRRARGGVAWIAFDFLKDAAADVDDARKPLAEFRHRDVARGGGDALQPSVCLLHGGRDGGGVDAFDDGHLDALRPQIRPKNSA